MEWLGQNWWWLLIIVVVVIYLISRSSSGSTRSSYSGGSSFSPSRLSGGNISDAQATALVRALIDAFDEILKKFLPSHYTSEHRHKIAIGMVAVMAAENITLEQMKDNPKLVIEVAAKSAVVLIKEGMIPPFER